MLKKEILIGLLIAVFSLGLIGVSIAEHGGHDNFEPAINTYVEKDTMAEAETTQPTAIELEHGNLDVQREMRDSAPLVCDTDPVQETNLFASNECADLYRG